MDNTKNHTFAIIGAGMSGILAGIKLKEAGYSFQIFEKADSVGGTWRENTYPGIACDVPSHIYSYSFELNPEWSSSHSPGEEIHKYFKNVAIKYGVEPSIRFNEGVTRCTWVDDEWEIETEKGHVERFKWVIAATGILHHPKYPDIEGMDDFEGPMFHTARWDHNIETKGKRIGLIGTGSSGVQITAEIAPEVEKLSVFQRTAQWVVPNERLEYTEEEREAFRTDADMLQNMHIEMSRAFNDGFATSVIDGESQLIDDIQNRCLEALETVEDLELREKLRPTYRAACKRLVVSHNFYDAVQRPNVNIITEAIDRIEKNGVRAGGELHELDVLVLATGFHVDAFMRPMDITGRNGIVLDEVWEDWPSAYLSIAVPEFPNFFMLNGPNSPVGNFSLIQTAEMQFDYVLKVVDHVNQGDLDVAAISEEAYNRFDTERYEAAKGTVWATGCNSWYLDNNGVPFAWPFPFSRFRSEMEAPKLEDYEPVKS
ncbi:MAG: NAD(P)/FAD-dependent oxidoreductase [Acidimicrobiales bacterium]|jgi:cation diffusion facilitator CzcD-associated flavoprotein CzcO|nr:NAD(P)/FAD-dependent oxidoreductase [Acidimicrobiales bacterium]HJM97395.1 NAD(P)/FAD-dependent oxidoreductase [Acidimicrobiales bacterium]